MFMIIKSPKQIGMDSILHAYGWLLSFSFFHLTVEFEAK